MTLYEMGVLMVWEGGGREEGKQEGGGGSDTSLENVLV